MALRNLPDGRRGPTAVPNPERSEDKVFLDRFADSPLCGTGRYRFFRSSPPINYFPSRPGVERLAQHKLNDRSAAFKYVHYVLERHEDAIRKRWCEKSTAKKKNLLLTAQPNIASEDCPDFAVDLAASTTSININEHRPSTTPVCTARDIEACLVPFLSLEDLLR